MRSVCFLKYIYNAAPHLIFHGHLSFLIYNFESIRKREKGITFSTHIGETRSRYNKKIHKFNDYLYHNQICLCLYLIILYVNFLFERKKGKLLFTSRVSCRTIAQTERTTRRYNLCCSIFKLYIFQCYIKQTPLGFTFDLKLNWSLVLELHLWPGNIAVYCSRMQSFF